MKVKNILFRAKLNGRGIVNFDSSEQKFVYNGTKLNHMKTMHDNTSYAKKRFYKNEDGELNYKICISSDCLRHDIFKDDVLFQNPSIINNESIFYSFIGSTASMLRGYMFADTKGTFKRKGALCIEDAIQTCNAVSSIETFSRSGKKNQDSEVVDNSFYKKEVVGEIEYETRGNIDLMQLQFVSTDDTFDRLAFNPDNFNTFKMFMNTRLPNFNSELGYYQINDSIVEIPEYGFKFSNENIVFMVKELLRKIATLQISRKGAYAEMNEIEYKLVYDVFEDVFDNENDWVSITNEKSIDDLNFETHDFYTQYDENKAKELRESIVADYESRKASKQDKKDSKKTSKKLETADAK